MAFVVCGGAALGVWLFLGRLDRVAELAIDTALAERVAAAESLTAATEPERQQAREKAIAEADAWVTFERGALFAKRCATASWLYTLVPIGLAAWTNTQDGASRFPMSLFGCGLLLAAIGLAIFALTEIRHHGRKGLLVPATITLVLNAIMIGFAVCGVVAP